MTVKKTYAIAQVEEFVKDVNRLRRESGLEWYRYEAVVAGKKVVIQAYKTWLRNFTVDGVEYGNVMDRKAAQFLADLREPFRRL